MAARLGVEIPLFDISCGGVSLMVEPPLAAFLDRGNPAQRLPDHASRKKVC